MNLLTAVTELISIFLFTTCFLFIARKVAKRIGLVDKPNFRKRHQGLIPLVGGISVYAGICFTFGIADYYIPHAALYLACAGVLVLVGALDDRYRRDYDGGGWTVFTKPRLCVWSLGVGTWAIWFLPDALCRLGSNQCFQHGGWYRRFAGWLVVSIICRYRYHSVV